MNFSTDRDLLALEPNVFNDVPLTSQRRLSVTDAAITGTTLASASADFVAAQVETGSVVLVNNNPLEVLARVDAAKQFVRRGDPTGRRRGTDAARRHVCAAGVARA